MLYNSSSCKMAEYEQNNTESDTTPLDINEKNVNIAVRFLCNQNVRDTPRDRKIKFLSAKGLNEEEIELALEKAEEMRLTTKEDEDSEWSFWDYFKGIVLSAGILSSANYAYKAYFLPYAAHEIKDDQRIEKLKESVQVLKDDLKQKTYEFTCTLKSIQTLLEEQKQLLANIEKELGKERNTSTDGSLDNIKSDLTALKSMMLSKDRFPTSPFSAAVAGSPSIEIPAWQKAKGEKTEEEKAGETNDDEKDDKEVEID